MTQPDETYPTAAYEQSPEVRENFGIYVRQHAIVERSEEEYDAPMTREYTITRGSLDVPATSLRAYSSSTRNQLEFYGDSISGLELIMTLLQDEGGEATLFVNKPRQVQVRDEYVINFLRKLDDLELNGDLVPKEDSTGLE
jgi:hypothetical protein